MRRFTLPVPLVIMALVVLAGIWCPAAENAPAPAPKIKVLLVTGHDVLPAHPWRETTQQDRATLEACGCFDVKVCEDVGIFESSTLGQYDVIVLNFGFWTAPELTPLARTGLLSFVKNGKGLVSVHFSCSSYQAWEEYKDLLGRVWKQGVGGHGPRGTFTVKIDDATHPITRGLSDFTIDDELYAKLTGDAEIKVLASAASAWSGKVEPLVFVKSYGKGRVVQHLLGHDVKVRSDANYQKILCRAVEWAATGTVTATK
jgi:uncharacterized protein